MLAVLLLAVGVFRIEEVALAVERELAQRAAPAVSAAIARPEASRFMGRLLPYRSETAPIVRTGAPGSKGGAGAVA